MPWMPFTTCLRSYTQLWCRVDDYDVFFVCVRVCREPIFFSFNMNIVLSTSNVQIILNHRLCGNFAHSDAANDISSIVIVTRTSVRVYQRYKMKKQTLAIARHTYTSFWVCGNLVFFFLIFLFRFDAICRNFALRNLTFLRNAHLSNERYKLLWLDVVETFFDHILFLIKLFVDRFSFVQ